MDKAFKFNRDHIASEWKSFHDQVLIPSGAGENQITESRKVFYAGVASTMSLCFAIGNPEVPEMDGVKQMDAVVDELVAFAMEMGMERLGKEMIAIRNKQ